eukprot:Clim_evm31s143 gene=Clim_evmTU31s143
MEAEFEEQDVCPVCKSRKSYLNPNFKLLLTRCGHRFCQSCKERIFRRHNPTCPECGQILRENEITDPQFDDLEVEKEMRVRKAILRTYNKTEEDFKDLRLYNDYLEEIEDIVFNLTNNVDVDETKARVAKYREENKPAITQAALRRQEMEKSMKKEIDEEEEERERHRQEAVQRLLQERQAKQELEQHVLDALSRGEDAIEVERMQRLKMEEIAATAGKQVATTDGEDKKAEIKKKYHLVQPESKRRIALPYTEQDYFDHIVLADEHLSHVLQAAESLHIGPYRSGSAERHRLQLAGGAAAVGFVQRALQECRDGFFTGFEGA